jgi:hypothetical protein
MYSYAIKSACIIRIETGTGIKNIKLKTNATRFTGGIEVGSLCKSSGQRNRL